MFILTFSGFTAIDIIYLKLNGNYRKLLSNF